MLTFTCSPLVLGLSAILLGTLVASQPQVEIRTGIVQGRTVATHYDGVSVNSFYNIPFATPPVGELRFREPLPAEPWEGVYNATGLGTSCVQGIGGLLWLTHPGYRDHDEDCLNLNVFTPEDMNPETPYPVMVWFYGGAFTGGSNIQYPGHFLAARNVIVVAVNYRVGIFGFASTDDDASRGNYGLYDQHLGLEWVQENIEAFGGDPTSVTLFGQSAGGASSSHHIVSPKSRGLFHRVIAESGTDMNFWSLNYPASEPEEYTRQVAANVNCPNEDTYEMMDCLRSIEQWELRNNSGFACKEGHFCQGHAPVVDGPDGFIPDYPQLLRDRGEFADEVQVMSGYLSDDGSFYTVIFIPEAWEGGFTREEFQRILRDNLLDIWGPQFDEETEENAYQATDFQYTPWPYLEDKEANRDAFNQMITDAAFGYVTDKQLLSHSKVRGGHYKYNFGYRSNGTLIDEGFWNNTAWAGVPHSAELPYVFGWANMKLAPQVRLDSRILIDIFDYNEEDFEYADYMMDLWTNFAKYGNPTPEPLEAPIGNGPIQFSEFTPDAYHMMNIAREVKDDIDYRSQYNAFFEQYISYIIGIDLYPGKATSTGRTKRSTPVGGIDSTTVDKAQRKLAQHFLTTAFPGQFNHLFEKKK